MGMYTEFYFRANLKDKDKFESPLRLDALLYWFKNTAGQDGWDDHEFFQCGRWRHVFIGSGAVYQFSNLIKVENGCSWQNPRITISSSLKDYDNEIEKFIDWIHPFLDHEEGEFLGYSLYEDSHRDFDGHDRERPTFFYFAKDNIVAVSG